MTVEFYSTLNEAAKSLKKGEGLYTDSRFLLDPVKVIYKKEGKSVYKATGLDHSGTTWDIGGGDKIMVSSYREKNGKKYVHAMLLKEKEQVRLGDTEYLYKSLILKTEELEELVEGIASLAENKRNLFKKPIIDAIFLGLKRINMKNKDVVLIEDFSEYNKKLGVIDFFRKQIIESTKDEEWKRKIRSYSLYFGDKARRELYKDLSNLTKEVETNIQWKEVLVVVDRVPGNKTEKIITKIWEDKEVLGIEIEGSKKLVEELQDHFNKHGKLSLEKSFPRLIGEIFISTSNLPKIEEAELALVPLEMVEENGTLKVDYLALVKLSVEDKRFLWSPIKPAYFDSEVKIRVLGENSVRILNEDKIPEKILSEKKEDRASKSELCRKD